MRCTRVPNENHNRSRRRPGEPRVVLSCLTLTVRRRLAARTSLIGAAARGAATCSRLSRRQLLAVEQGDVGGHMLLRGGDTPLDELRRERRATRLVQRAELALGVEEDREAARGKRLLLGTRVLRST